MRSVARPSISNCDTPNGNAPVSSAHSFSTLRSWCGDIVAEASTITQPIVSRSQEASPPTCLPPSAFTQQISREASPHLSEPRNASSFMSPSPLDTPFEPLDTPFEPLDTPLEPLDTPLQPLETVLRGEHTKTSGIVGGLVAPPVRPQPAPVRPQPVPRRRQPQRDAPITPPTPTPATDSTPEDSQFIMVAGQYYRWFCTAVGGCDFRFNRLQDAARHASMHAQAETQLNVKCRDRHCVSHFKAETEMYVHWLLWHASDDEVELHANPSVRDAVLEQRNKRQQEGRVWPCGPAIYFPCKRVDCNAFFDTQEHRDAHCVTHDVPRPWICTVRTCQRDFTHFRQLKGHAIESHPDATEAHVSFIRAGAFDAMLLEPEEGP
ncbi:hypothetical protein FB45DRAFT_538421 [Roridomyces roridus]|uniref:C2H2-type domain-containing protein n=1 Tax=Roridomyces roridus TaxID=1738132 RepID=A0AAD7BUS0_9AGAR|nr:hypothetical protein FB45DRAFT_538421 [Roridomyces roridus]